MEVLASVSYYGFEYKAHQLSKYIQAADLFTIKLEDQTIIHFTPSDPEDFKSWLEMHLIEDIG